MQNRIINVLIDEANHTYIAMPMYNLIEYSDNCSDTSGSLWQFKREEPPANNADLNVNNGVFNSIPVKVFKQRTNIYELLSASFQCVKRLFVVAYFINAPFALAVSDEVGIKKQ